MIRLAFQSPIDEAAFTAWLQRAAAGERLTYWRGHLARDVPRLHGEDRLRLESVSRLAWNMAQKGWLHLLQQRHGPHDFSYVAVRRRRVPATSSTLAA